MVSPFLQGYLGVPSQGGAPQSLGLLGGPQIGGGAPSMAPQIPMAQGAPAGGGMMPRMMPTPGPQPQQQGQGAGGMPSITPQQIAQMKAMFQGPAQNPQMPGQQPGQQTSPLSSYIAGTGPMPGSLMPNGINQMGAVGTASSPADLMQQLQNTPGVGGAGAANQNSWLQSLLSHIGMTGFGG